MCRPMIKLPLLDVRAVGTTAQLKEAAVAVVEPYVDTAEDAESSVSSDDLCSSPLASMLQPSAEPSPFRVPQPPESAAPLQHETVSRCLFSGNASMAFGALPRLIVPAHPLASCYGDSPMQLPTPAPAAGQKPGSRAGSVKEWLEVMEQHMGSGNTASRNSCQPQSSLPAPGCAETVSTGYQQLVPAPAFVLMGLLQ